LSFDYCSLIIYPFKFIIKILFDCLLICNFTVYFFFILLFLNNKIKYAFEQILVLSQLLFIFLYLIFCLSFFLLKLLLFFLFWLLFLFSIVQLFLSWFFKVLIFLFLLLLVFYGIFSRLDLFFEIGDIGCRSLNFFLKLLYRSFVSSN
jgi:hypothetical protein